MKIALYLGRFQPFHNGHLSVVLEQLRKGNYVIIAICSAQYSGTNRNPFDVWKRYEMIYSCIKQYKGRFKIIPMCDIHDQENWAEYVCKVIPEFDFVISNNDNTSNLFKKIGVNVYNPPSYYKKNGNKLNATYVRGILIEWIIYSNDNYFNTNYIDMFTEIKSYVPQQVFNIIKSMRRYYPIS